MSSRIRAVVFDLYGVVEVPVVQDQRHTAWCAGILREFLARQDRSVSEHDCVAAVQAATDLIMESASDYPMSLHPLLWRLALSNVAGASYSEEDAAALFALACEARASTKPIYDDVWDAVARLSTSFRLGILSNGNSMRIRGMLGAVGLLAKMDAVLVSGEWPFRKPDAEMFSTMAALLGTEPSKCLMVGDRLDTDIAGARSVGMSTVLLRRRSRDDMTPPSSLASKRPFSGLDDITDLVLRTYHDK